MEEPGIKQETKNALLAIGKGAVALGVTGGTLFLASQDLDTFMKLMDRYGMPTAIMLLGVFGLMWLAKSVLRPISDAYIAAVREMTIATSKNTDNLATLTELTGKQTEINGQNHLSLERLTATTESASKILETQNQILKRMEVDQKEGNKAAIAAAEMAAKSIEEHHKFSQRAMDTICRIEKHHP